MDVKNPTRKILRYVLFFYPKAAVYPMARLSIPWKSDKTGGKSAFSVDRNFSPGV